MRNEFEEHGKAMMTTVVGGLISAGGALLVGALAKSRKEKEILKVGKFILSKKK